MKKKALALLLLLMLVIAPVFSQPATETTAAAAETTATFTDDLGRTVTLPSPLERVAPSGNMAQVILTTYDPSLMVGMAQKFTAERAKYIDYPVTELPVFGAFYGAKSNLNKEAVIAADPQVVIDIGEIKGNTESMISDLDNLTSQLGIPVVFIESYLADTPHTYRRLGELLGDTERAEEMALYAEEAIAFAAEVKEKSGESRSFYYSTSADGLQAIPEGSFHGEVLEAVGGRNVVDSSFSSGSNQISLEQLLILDPDVIFLSSEEAYKAVTDPAGPWSTLTAVKNGEVYVPPVNIYSWIDSPPSVNRLLGIYYAAQILYPEIANVDIVAESQRYFDLFYGYQLSADEVKL